MADRTNEKMSTSLEFHPAAGIVPSLTAEEQAELTQDIRKHGLRFPITLYQEKILDGRHRYRACLEAGVDPHFQEYDGTDPVGFVISAAIHRRHLSVEQKRAVTLEALKQNPARSDREVGKLTNTDHKTVGAMRRKLESTGEIPQLSETVGRDNKSRKRRPAAKKPQTKERQQAADDAQPEANDAEATAESRKAA